MRPGWWGEIALGGGWSSDGRVAPLPGVEPVPDGGQGLASVRADAAGRGWWAHAAVDASLASDDGRATEPALDPRAQWSGLVGDAGRDAAWAHLEAEAGIAVARQLVLAGNRPLHWGPGILGGVVLGRAPRGFPHLAVQSGEPWLLGEAGGAPVALAQETVIGRLDRAGDDDWLAAQRLGLRVGPAEFGASAAWSRAGSLGAPGDADHAAIAIDAALSLFGSVRASGEFGGRRAPRGERGGSADALAWVLTIDAYDLAADGRWRLAAEWHHAGAAVDLPGGGAWTSDGVPLAHADGPNAESLSLVGQHRLESDGTIAAIAAWRRRGHEDADGGAASQALPSLAWTLWTLDLRLELPLAERWWLRMEAGVGYERNAGNVADDERWVGSAAAMVGVWF